jgi:hypothetical protein
MVRNNEGQMLQAAMEFQALGVPVFPCLYKAKQPATIKGVHSASLNPDDLLYWWGESPVPPTDPTRQLSPGLRPSPEYNVGLAMGHTLCCIDIDGDKGRAAFDNWCREMGVAMPATPTVDTPGRNGGVHLYFLTPAGVEVRKRQIVPSVDLYGLGVYVVAPGSVHPDGPRYKWRDGHTPADVEFAPLPRVFMDEPKDFFRFGDMNAVDTSPGATLGEAIRSAADHAVSSAIKDAYVGNRNNTAWKLACQLRDNGLDRSEASLYMEQFFRSIDNKGFNYSEVNASLRSAFNRTPRDPYPRVERAKEREWKRGTAQPPTGLDPPANTPPEAPTDARKYIPCSDFAATPPNTSYCIKHILPANGAAMIFGDSNVGKSFLALDMAFHVALGLEWFGHKVRQKGVVYFAGEGINGLKGRARAWLDHHEQYAPDDMHFWPWPINLTDPASTVDHARMMVEQLPRFPSMIVIDTLAANFGAGDENKQEDMGRAIRSIQALSEKACVLIIHHTSKANQNAARGSNALQGHVDVAISLTRKDLNHPVTVYMDKVRDGSKRGTKLFFDIISAPTPWLDEDKEPIRSAVIEQVEEPGESLSAVEEECLRRLVDMAGKELGNRIPTSLWYSKISGIVTDASNRNKIKKALAGKNKIAFDGESVWTI